MQKKVIFSNAFNKRLAKQVFMPVLLYGNMAISGSDNIVYSMDIFICSHRNFVGLIFRKVLVCAFQMFYKYSMFKYFTNMCILSFVRLQTEIKICYLKTNSVVINI